MLDRLLDSIVPDRRARVRKEREGREYTEATESFRQALAPFDSKIAQLEDGKPVKLLEHNPPRRYHTESFGSEGRMVNVSARRAGGQVGIVADEKYDDIVVRGTGRQAQRSYYAMHAIDIVTISGDGQIVNVETGRNSMSSAEYIGKKPIARLI